MVAVSYKPNELPNELANVQITNRSVTYLFSIKMSNLILKGKIFVLKTVVAVLRYLSDGESTVVSVAEIERLGKNDN